MAHIHSVYDTDLHFSISPKSRTILDESGTKTVLIQGDHNSERCTFELPRVIDGHDMLKCNVVQIHYNNVDAVSKASSRDVYEVDDLQVSPEDENVVICSWLISRNATKYVGALGFLLRFACSSDGSHIDYAWHTAVCTALSVSTGIDNTGIVVEEFSDVLEQWRQQLIAGSLNFGSVNAGKLLCVGSDGVAQPLPLGTGLEIVDGKLVVTGSTGGGTDTSQVFYTADGSVFYTVDDAMLYVTGG